MSYVISKFLLYCFADNVNDLVLTSITKKGKFGTSPSSNRPPLSFRTCVSLGSFNLLEVSFCSLIIQSEKLE